METTLLEKQLIQKIATDECTSVNGAEPEDRSETETWTSNVVESQSDGGVASSLIKKGLIYCESGRDGVIGLTDEGFTVYKSI